MEVTSPFGSRTRTQVLLALQLLDQSYPRELSRLLEISLSVVQKAIRSLEADELVAGRSVGRTRTFQLNPRYFARREIRELLVKLLETDRQLKQRASRLRRRPRRTGKRL
jgi:DNA-binding transcriptional ArsR family regulator